MNTLRMVLCALAAASTGPSTSAQQAGGLPALQSDLATESQRAKAAEQALATAISGLGAVQALDATGKVLGPIVSLAGQAIVVASGGRLFAIGQDPWAMSPDAPFVFWNYRQVLYFGSADCTGTAYSDNMIAAGGFPRGIVAEVARLADGRWWVVQGAAAFEFATIASYLDPWTNPGSVTCTPTSFSTELVRVEVLE